MPGRDKQTQEWLEEQRATDLGDVSLKYRSAFQP